MIILYIFLLFSIFSDRGVAVSFFNNPPSEPPPVNLGHLMGTGMPEMFTNARTAINSNAISPILLRFTN